MRHKLEILLAKTIASGLTGHRLTSCSKWAEERRMMGEPFPGPYSFKFFPWNKELHNSWSPYSVCMKSAQAGVTESAINRAFFTLDKLKRDVLYVLPTALAASDFSKSRFGAALELSPYLKQLFVDTNAVNIKRTGANTLYIRGARGRSNLKSVPVSELIIDELDECEPDKIKLAMERLSGQIHKHFWAISTPTIPEFGVHKWYLDSTQEKFCFACPSCGKQIELKWPESVVIVGDRAADPRCKESYYKCTECGAKLNQEDKPNFLKSGIWVPTVAANSDIRGFHINQLYSFTITPGELVSDYLGTFSSEVNAKEFHNSKLGLPYIGSGARITPDLIDQAVRDYSMGSARPRRAGERLITIGADQGKLGTVVVSEWLPVRNAGKDISASFDCKVLAVHRFGDEEIWDRLGELMIEWQALYAVIDADPELNLARAFCKKFDGHAAVTRYRGVKATKEISETERETGAPMLTVDRTFWLSTALGRFKTKRIIVPKDTPDYFREHVCNMVHTYKRIKEDKRDTEETAVAVYVSLGEDHAAHALTYAEIALHRAPSFGSHSLGKIF